MNQDTKNEKLTSESEESAVSTANEMLEQVTQQVTQLHTALVERATAVEEIHTVVLEQERAFQTKLAEQTQEIEDLKKSLEEAGAARDVAVQELAQIREEAKMKARIEVLSGNAILRASEDAKTKQIEKIKVMSEEEFSAYVEELVDTRNQALASVKSNETAETNTVAVPEASVTSEVEIDLAALAMSATNAEAEEMKESASSKEEKVENKPNANALRERFSQIFSRNLKDSENKEGVL